MSTPILRAIAVLGTPYRLARAVGVKPPTVHGWVKTGRVPATRVLAVEAATGVSRHALRPDIFGPDPTQLDHDNALNP